MMKVGRWYVPTSKNLQSTGGKLMCKEASIGYNSFFTVCNNMVRVGFVGYANGNHNLGRNTVEAAGKIEILGSAMGAKRILAPLPGFVINYADISQATPLKYGSKILRDFKNPADMGVAYDLETAITFCNADCPIGILANIKTKQWAMLHLGLKNLLGPQDLISYATDLMSDGKPENLYFWCGAGIGPCCYGVNDKKQLDQARKISPLAVDKNPPVIGRRSGTMAGLFGFRAVNIHSLVEVIAQSKGFGHVQMDYLCTSCARDEYGQPRFYSNVAQGMRSSERNCFIGLGNY